MYMSVANVLHWVVCRPLPEYLKTEIALALKTEAYAPNEVSTLPFHVFTKLNLQSLACHGT